MTGGNRRRHSHADVWTGYSTRDAAECVGLSPSAVRSCARAGLLRGDGQGVALRFSFQDLKILRLVKELVDGGITLRRARRQLATLSERLTPDTPLAALPISGHYGHVVVRDGARTWHADSGQLLLGFEQTEEQGSLSPLRQPEDPQAVDPDKSFSADQWFDEALSMEEASIETALAAYQQALTLRPDWTDALINIGRLHAENGELDQAQEFFGRALDLDPDDPTAHYNMGVVSQDSGQDTEAIAFYQRALELDTTLAEAHYNLATIYDQTGDGHAAIRHINAYRKLVRR